MFDVKTSFSGNSCEFCESTPVCMRVEGWGILDGSLGG